MDFNPALVYIFYLLNYLLTHLLGSIKQPPVVIGQTPDRKNITLLQQMHTHIHAANTRPYNITSPQTDTHTDNVVSYISHIHTHIHT